MKLSNKKTKVLFDLDDEKDKLEAETSASHAILMLIASTPAAAAAVSLQKRSTHSLTLHPTNVDPYSL